MEYYTRREWRDAALKGFLVVFELTLGLSNYDFLALELLSQTNTLSTVNQLRLL
jgi:hypothetical protein